MSLTIYCAVYRLFCQGNELKTGKADNLGFSEVSYKRMPVFADNRSEKIERVCGRILNVSHAYIREKRFIGSKNGKRMHEDQSERYPFPK